MIIFFDWMETSVKGLLVVAFLEDDLNSLHEIELTHRKSAEDAYTPLRAVLDTAFRGACIL